MGSVILSKPAPGAIGNPPLSEATTCDQLVLRASNAGVPDKLAFVRSTVPDGDSLGSVMFLSGGSGTDPFSAPVNVGGLQLMQEVLAAGFEVLELFYPNGWSMPGSMFKNASERPAIALQWAQNNRCTHPMMVFGNSGGSDQVLRALAHWNAKDYLSTVIAGSGSPTSRMQVLCHEPVDPAWRSESEARMIAAGIDPAHVSLTSPPGSGGCNACGSAGPGVLDEVSLLHQAPGSTLVWPNCDVHFIVGSDDTNLQTPDSSAAVPQALLCHEMVQPGTKTLELVEAPHFIAATPQGRAAIKRWLGIAC